MSSNPFESFITRAAFCEQAGISTRTAELWVTQRRGPKVTIIGRCAYYHVDDVGAWLKACRNKGNAPAKPRKRRAA